MTDSLTIDFSARDPVLAKKTKDLENMLAKLASLGDMMAGKKDMILQLQEKLKALQTAALSDADYESELDGIYQLLNEATSSVKSITQVQLDEISKYKSPPDRIKTALEAIMYLLHKKVMTWDQIKSEMAKGNFISDVLKFNLAKVPIKVVNYVKVEYIQKDTWNLEKLKKASKAMGPLGEWLQSQLTLSEVYEKKPAAKEVIARRLEQDEVKQEIAQLEADVGNLAKETVELEVQIDTARQDLEDAKRAAETKQATRRGSALVRRPSQAVGTMELPPLSPKSEPIKPALSSKLIQTEAEEPPEPAPAEPPREPRQPPTLSLDNFGLFFNPRTVELPKPPEIKVSAAPVIKTQENFRFFVNKKVEEPPRVEWVPPPLAPKTLTSFNFLINAKTEESVSEVFHEAPPMVYVRPPPSQKTQTSFNILFNSREEPPAPRPSVKTRPPVPKATTSYSFVFSQHVDEPPAEPRVITIEVPAPRPEVFHSVVQTDPQTVNRLSSKNIQTDLMPLAKQSSKVIQTSFPERNSVQLQTDAPPANPRTQTSFSMVYSPHVDMPPRPPEIVTVEVPAPKPKVAHFEMQTDSAPSHKLSSKNIQTETAYSIKQSSKNIQTNLTERNSVKLQTEEPPARLKTQTSFSVVYNPHVDQLPPAPQIVTIEVPAPRPETANTEMQTDAPLVNRLSSKNIQTETAPSIPFSSKNVQTNFLERNSVMLQTDDSKSNDRFNVFDDISLNFTKQRNVKAETISEPLFDRPFKTDNTELGTQTELLPADIQLPPDLPLAPPPTPKPGDLSSVSHSLSHEPDMLLDSDSARFYNDLMNQPASSTPPQMPYTRVYYGKSRVLPGPPDLPLNGFNNPGQAPELPDNIRRVSNTQGLNALPLNPNKRSTVVNANQPDVTQPKYYTTANRGQNSQPANPNYSVIEGQLQGGQSNFSHNNFNNPGQSPGLPDNIRRVSNTQGFNALPLNPNKRSILVSSNQSDVTLSKYYATANRGENPQPMNPNFSVIEGQLQGGPPRNGQAHFNTEPRRQTVIVTSGVAPGQRNAEETAMRRISKTPERVEQRDASANLTTRTTRVSKIIVFPPEGQKTIVNGAPGQMGQNMSQQPLNSRSVDIVSRKTSMIVQGTSMVAPLQSNPSANPNPSPGQSPVYAPKGSRHLIWKNWEFQNSSSQSIQDISEGPGMREQKVQYASEPKLPSQVIFQQNQPGQTRTVKHSIIEPNSFKKVTVQSPLPANGPGGQYVAVSRTSKLVSPDIPLTDALLQAVTEQHAPPGNETKRQ